MQQCLISFENTSQCLELELHVFNKWPKSECMCFICGNSHRDLNTLWFSVLNKNENLRVLKPYLYLSGSCVLIISYVKLANFLKYFVMMHKLWKVVNGICFISSFPFLVIGVMCMEMFNMFQRVESIYKMLTGFPSFFW